MKNSMKLSKDELKKAIGPNPSPWDRIKLLLHIQSNGKKDIEESLRQDWEAIEENDLSTAELNAKDEIWSKLSHFQHSEKTPPLSKQRNILPYKAIAAAIALILCSSIIYSLLNSQPSTIHNQSGKPMLVNLADGSTVWLTPEAEITIPKNFSGTSRQISLNGSAHFKIDSDPSNPFVINTSYGNTKVTGTEFFIEELAEKDSFEISLYEGKIEVTMPDTPIGQSQKVVLKPGERITGGISTKRFSAQTETQKKQESKNRISQGLLQFRNTPMQEVFKSLEKWYNIKIDLSQYTEKDIKLNYSIQTNSMTIEEAIEGINIITPYKIVAKENRQYVVL
ncbi:FecR family protein [Roseivirga pacifica]|uniref:FecR family protein n=1 Tax=Roseivirga pacifica TaxID=1267423 RepID=UPI003BB14F69